MTTFGIALLLGIFSVVYGAFICSLIGDSKERGVVFEAIYMFLGAILSCSDKQYAKTYMISRAAYDRTWKNDDGNKIMQAELGRHFQAQRVWNYLNDGSNLDRYADALVKHLSFGHRRNFAHLLFKLAAQDDGINNEEWHRLLSIMSLLKMNKANYDFLIRQYVGLRTEFDDYSSQHQNISGSSALSADYALLGLTASASQREVQAAYHKLAMQYHPDLPKNANNQQFCIDQMTKINAAYNRIMPHYL